MTATNFFPKSDHTTAKESHRKGGLGGGVALIVLAALAFAQGGCSSEPLASDLAMDLPEVGRAVVGYNETDYVYPIRVPNTNRYVQMRTSEPLDYQPTYEDYLKWKKDN